MSRSRYRRAGYHVLQLRYYVCLTFSWGFGVIRLYRLIAAGVDCGANGLLLYAVSRGVNVSEAMLPSALIGICTRSFRQLFLPSRTFLHRLVFLEHLKTRSRLYTQSF